MSQRNGLLYESTHEARGDIDLRIKAARTDYVITLSTHENYRCSRRPTGPPHPNREPESRRDHQRIIEQSNEAKQKTTAINNNSTRTRQSLDALMSLPDVYKRQVLVFGLMSIH